MTWLIEQNGQIISKEQAFSASYLGTSPLCLLIKQNDTLFLLFGISRIHHNSCIAKLENGRTSVCNTTVRFRHRNVYGSVSHYLCFETYPHQQITGKDNTWKILKSIFQYATNSTDNFSNQNTYWNILIFTTYPDSQHCYHGIPIVCLWDLLSSSL